MRIDRGQHVHAFPADAVNGQVKHIGTVAAEDQAFRVADVQKSSQCFPRVEQYPRCGKRKPVAGTPRIGPDKTLRQLHRSINALGLGERGRRVIQIDHVPSSRTS